MPGEVEIIENQNAEKNGGHQKTVGGSWKLLQLFRLKPRRWRGKQSDGNGGKKQKKSPDERRDQLDRDMKNNWEQLPATLRRRKEKLSQAMLDQFTEDVNPTNEDIKIDSSSDSGKQTRLTDQTSVDLIHLASLEELSPEVINKSLDVTEQDVASLDSLQLSSQIIVKPQIHRECSDASLECEAKTEENPSEEYEFTSSAQRIQQDSTEDKPALEINIEAGVENDESELNDETEFDDKDLCTENKSATQALTSESCSKEVVLETKSSVDSQYSDGNNNSESVTVSSADDCDQIEHSDSSSNINNSLDESDSKIKTEIEKLFLPNISYVHKEKDDSARSKTPTSPLQTNSETSPNKDNREEPSTSRSSLMTLPRAVSEDSLLVPSSPSSTSASSVNSSGDERNNDSGTDVNSPSSSNVSTSKTMSHYQNPRSPLKSITDCEINKTQIPSRQDSSATTDSGIANSQSMDSASSTSSSPTSKNNHKDSKLMNDEEKSMLNFASNLTSTYVSAKSQSSSTDSSNCCVSSLPDDPVLYEVVIPRAEYHKPSHIALKTSEYQRPKDRSLHETHQEKFDFSSGIEFDNLITEERSKTKHHPKLDEDDVMSYYDAVVEESLDSSAKFGEETKDIFGKCSYCPLTKRSVIDNKEYEYVAKDLYINDYIHADMKNHKSVCNGNKHVGIGNAFSKRYATMEFVSGFGTVVDNSSKLSSDTNKGGTFTKNVSVNSDIITGDKVRWYPEVTGGKWKKPFVLETLNKKPVTMATIMEEREGEAESSATTVNTSNSEKLSVREILRRFEELGGRVQLPTDIIEVEGESDAEKSATLREIQETLRCLEEKVRHHETKAATTQTLDTNENWSDDKLLQKVAPRITDGLVPSKIALDAWTGHSRSAVHQQQAHSHQSSAVLQPHNCTQQQHYQHQQRSIVTSSPQPPEPPSRHDGKHSLLQFAMLHFRQSPEKFEMLKTADGSISGSLKVIESLKSNKKNKGKKGNRENDWTWKEQVDLVKFSSMPIEQSLLRLEPGELSDLAVECFAAVMRYMGDLPMSPDSTEVKCVYTILMHCHKHEALRDEVYCQLMKQTTNNKSPKPDSCQRGWRLFSIVAAYFVCSDTLKPYLFKYLETAAYDKRRAYHGKYSQFHAQTILSRLSIEQWLESQCSQEGPGTATVCLQNLRKTFKYGGRKNVPSVEEITAISAGRNSKRQIYRLPGGTERVVNTKSTTVVQDVIEELCTVIGVTGGEMEMEEFSLYCIVEGDTFTMPLAREEYILDVTTELHKNQQVFYLIYCRSVWHFPLRLDSQLYVEVVFNQIAPDYLEGLLLVMPGEQLDQDVIYDIAKMAALLHRAADMTHVPTMKETKFLLPKPALTVRDVKPAQWVNMVQSNWRDVEMLTTIQSKAQVLDILSKWPLFGSSFFAVKRVSDPKERSDHILALNRHGVHFIDLVTHETLTHYPFSEVISTRKVKSEDGTLFLDMKCGNLMQQRITRLQTDQAHEISRLIRQYITMEQRLQQRSAA